MSTKVKFILTYLVGVVSGVIFAFVFAVIVNALFLVNKSDENNEDNAKSGVVLFDKPKVVIEADVIEIFQVLPDGSALARVGYTENGNNDNVGMEMMLHAKDTASYFDRQKIKIPKGKDLRQIGIYKYLEHGIKEKTVPVVAIFDK